MGIRAKCSHCDYLRSFSEDLAGTYYRCPRCGKGVIAVGRDPSSTDDGSSETARTNDASVSPERAERAERTTEVDDGSGEEQQEGVDETPRGALGARPGDAAVRGPEGKRPAKVRRILVECAACGYHVAIPPELFGKTVHCPECRVDITFSESSLEPVKAEILGRIAMDQAERRALDHAVPGPIVSPEAVRRARNRRLLVYALVSFAVAFIAASVARLFR